MNNGEAGHVIARVAVEILCARVWPRRSNRLNTTKVEHERLVVNSKSYTRGSDVEALKMFASIAESVWMLTIGYSVFQCAVVENFARRNAEFIAELTSALRRNEAADDPEGQTYITNLCADAGSPEELLALDRVSIECRALGKTMGNLTMPLRTNLIVASRVVC